MSLLNRKMSTELIHCVGTDIPLMSSLEFSVWGGIEEAVELKKSNILSLDEVFDGRTFTKRERFEMISILIKRKIIKRVKIDYLTAEYTNIPTMSYRQSSEIRIYPKLSKRNRMDMIKKFK
jgi:hypothetical protein